MNKKDIILNIVLILISILFFLGILEVGLGIFAPQIDRDSTFPNFFQYHETFGWINRPNAEGIFKDINKEYSVKVKNNPNGLRDVNHSYAKQDGLRRIVILGDSQTWGSGVEQFETFSAILNSSLDGVEVINMGVAGYGNDQELLLLKDEGLKYKPDTIILAFTVNNDVANNIVNYSPQTYYKPMFVLNGSDLDLTNVPVPKIKYKNTNVSAFTSFKLYLRTHTHTYPFIANRLMNTPLIRKKLEKIGIADPRTPFSVDYRQYAKNYTSQTNDEWNLTKRILKEIANTAKENNASFLIIIIPDKPQVYEKYWEIAKRQAEDDQQYVLSKPDDILLEFGKENNILVLDLLPEFKKHGNESEELYFKADGHLNKKGHKLIAELVHKVLIEENLIANR